MSKMAIKVEVEGTLDEVCNRIVEVIKPAGFGILTRIDFDKKIKEKLDETINPCVILGACNPKLAYDAYTQTTDAALLMPCNIVVTDIGQGKIKVEAIRPTLMLQMLPDVASDPNVLKAELQLESVLQRL
ncbi:MAG: hypothetical protein COW00_06970 [Bdellovibrio sp. CG12_big_fil_rev_8_21_14_0_65_39_13]|nr:MAG: hypothetical protein COW78_03095 [Bdellovibrio sp. CG22_combo_CG10-13_8_21_14_all_39_27]PIQ60345.1 MAG: hypothetical protein COW00_06970 [Bdellovibrio sp. CG12_big_fil_rev_8_21_14_0_65_39_13]PIR35045.1 MAG: hypothetical protein COV37_10490 [Bdellovibrio sp. CG11_big_fil_rev_8_21_14_0_20_39_38]